MTASAAFKPMSKNDVGDVLGVSMRTIENWVNDGTLPAPSKLGNRCYWHPSAFYSWLDRRLLGEGAEPVVIKSDAPVASCEPTAQSKPVATKPVRPAKQSAVRATALNRMRAKDDAELKALMCAGVQGDAK